jgi:hypothetical protein
MRIIGLLPNLDNMVEIGVFEGAATEIFAGSFKKVYAVDPWDSRLDPYYAKFAFDMKFHENNFDKNVLSKFNNIVKYKMTSKEASKLFENESLDFVYIDGNHIYESVKEDIEIWFPKIKTGSYIGGDDFDVTQKIEHIRGVYKAIMELFNGPDMTFPDTSWVIKKKA